VVPTFVLPIREYLLTGLTAAVVTFLLVGPVRVLALRLGAVAWPRGRDVHVTPTPRWGGLAMLGGVLAGVGMAYQLPALRLAFDNNAYEMLGVFGAAVLLAGVGALDDRYELDALTKFAGQTTAAGILVIFGVQWTVFYVPWGGGGTGISGSLLILGQEQGVLLTVLVTVALVNAVNFVDGLDGLAAGIGMIAAAATGLFSIGLVQRVGNDPAAYSPALIAAVLAGACLGFLPHNFNPARIFMGDSGSMLIGLLLAAATTSASGKIALYGANGTDVLALFAPLVVLAAVVAVPLLDLLMAVVRRTRKGMSPFSPDKMHLHHRLLEIGHSQRRAVLLIYLWAGVLAFGAVALALIDDPFIVLWAVGIGLVVAVLATAIPRVRQRTQQGVTTTGWDNRTKRTGNAK
jgi:UDP-GlcNAc:undecaprenyl-phosphate GlcNAc-1-phosphate transferase